MKKSRLNELALAGEVQQKLLTQVAATAILPDTPNAVDFPHVLENNSSDIDFSESESADEINKKQALDSFT